MDEIIIRSLQGRSSPADEEALRRWRQESLHNERHYRDMARTWRLAGLIEPGSADVHAAAAPAHAVPPLKVMKPVSRSSRFRRAATALLAAAAFIAVGIGIGLITGPADADRLAAEEFVTGRHEMVTVRLTDGTVVRLAPSSRLRVGQQGRERQVWLDGRGFFAVAKDSSRAFVVRTRTGDAVVLGTRFDVNVDENGMQVFVVEGRVAHQAGGAEVEVGAMQLSRVTEGGPPEVQAIADSKPLLSWLGEFLVFQATPMREVALELERRFDVVVRVADPGIAARTVTAWFTDESLEEVLLIVCRAADAHCTIRDDRVSIEP
jgi:transmembrane sensor